MNQLENFSTRELSASEMTETSGGFGLLFIAFHLGLALAYYEERVKTN